MQTAFSVELSTRYRKADNLVAREIAGETLLVPIRGRLADMRRIFALDPVAAFIWQCLDAPCTPTEILELIQVEFDVPREKAKSDLLSFLSDLLQADLIIRTDPETNH